MIDAFFVGFAVFMTGIVCLGMNLGWFFTIISTANDNELKVFSRIARYSGFTCLWLLVWLTRAYYTLDKTLVELKPSKGTDYETGRPTDLVHLPDGSVELLNEKYKTSFEEGTIVWTYQRGKQYGIDFSGSYELLWKKPVVKEGKLKLIDEPVLTWKIVGARDRPRPESRLADLLLHVSSHHRAH